VAPVPQDDAFAFDESTFDQPSQQQPNNEFEGFDTTAFDEPSPSDVHSKPEAPVEEEKKEEPAEFEYPCMVLSKNVLNSECQVEINDPQI